MLQRAQKFDELFMMIPMVSLRHKTNGASKAAGVFHSASFIGQNSSGHRLAKDSSKNVVGGFFLPAFI